MLNDSYLEDEGLLHEKLVTVDSNQSISVEKRHELLPSSFGYVGLHAWNMNRALSPRY